ncbi:MAG: hypothetical protein ACOCZ6_03630 [Nanoarchaeota archaeon]
MNSKIHFYLSTIFLFLGFFVLMAAFLDEPGQADINARFIAAQVECSDKTPVGKCSEEYVGNMCKNTKNGTMLNLSSKCDE